MFDSNDGAGGFDGSGNFTEGDLPSSGHPDGQPDALSDAASRQSAEERGGGAGRADSFDQPGAVKETRKFSIENLLLEQEESLTS